MDSSQPWNHPAAHHHHHHRPCPHQPPHHHHHYHLHFSPNCPLHSRLLQHMHPHPCPTSLPFLNPSISQVPQSAEAYPSDTLMMQEGNEEAFEEDEEDPIFVLTDEWREFFAKSEAKRRLAKKEAKKKGKASAG